MSDQDTVAGEEALKISRADAQHAFAWGRYLGSLIFTGFAFWKLGLKAMNEPPSEMLAGLSRTYDQVRDFVLLPLQWADLSSTERDLLVLTGLLAGATVRALFRVPGSADILFAGFVTAAITQIMLGFFDITIAGVRIAPVQDLDELLGIGEARFWIYFAASLAVQFALITPVLGLALNRVLPGASPATGRRLFFLILVNVLFSFACGAFLLVLNWATM